MKSSSSAPGKVILFGEHAVVYGIPAIAAATSDLRLYVDLELIDENKSVDSSLIVILNDIRDSNGNPSIHRLFRQDLCNYTSNIISQGPLNVIKPTEPMLQPLRQVFHDLNSHAVQGLMATIYLIASILPEWIHYNTNHPSNDDSISLSHSLSVNVKSHGLPIGAGLGSSAAFSVALAGSILLLRQRLYHDIIQGPWKEEDIDNIEKKIRPPVEILNLLNDWSYASEVVIHGTPSGLDNYTSCYGGVVKYDKSASKFESFRSLSRPLHMLLTNTKIPRSTKILVAGVRKLYDTFPSVMIPILDAIGGISTSFLHLIDDTYDYGNSKKLSDKEFLLEMNELIRMNQSLLSAIGVSHPALQIICDESHELGFSAKLTGAGGGGCALTLLDVGTANSSLFNESTKSEANVLFVQAVLRLKNKLRSHGFDVFESALAGDGVLWHL